MQRRTKANSQFNFNRSKNFAKSKCSQSAIEFVLLVGFVLFFFTVFIVTIKANMSDKLQERDDLLIKEIALTVKDEINLALESTDGYSRKFTLPQNINGRNYEIVINEDAGMVYVHTLDDRNAIALPVAGVVGDPKIGSNIIKKENGIVYLN